MLLSISVTITVTFSITIILAIFAIAIPVIAVAIASTSSGGSSVDNIARKLRPPAGDAVHGVGHLVPGEAVIAHHIEYLIR